MSFALFAALGVLVACLYEAIVWRARFCEELSRNLDRLFPPESP